jgi:hypothetical protein
MMGKANLPYFSVNRCTVLLTVFLCVHNSTARGKFQSQHEYYNNNDNNNNFPYWGVESKLGPLSTSATYLPRVIVKMENLVE